MRAILDKFELERIARASGHNVGEIIQKLAQDCEGDMKNHMSTQSPSAPGEPPGVDTGNLKNSIVAESGDNDLTWVVNIGANYGIDLEYGTRHMAARPFVLPSFERIVNGAPRQLFARIIE